MSTDTSKSNMPLTGECNMANVRKSGETIIAQASDPCAHAGFGQVEEGEVTDRSTNLLSFALEDGNGVIMLFYDLECIPVLAAAKHMSHVAEHVGSDPYNVPSAVVRPHRQGGGLALPLSAAYSPHRLLTPEDSVKLAAPEDDEGLIVAHNDEGTGRASLAALKSFNPDTGVVFDG